MEKTLVSNIIRVITIVIIVAGVSLIFYNYFYPSLKLFAFDKLPSNVKQNIIINWDSFVGNVTSCMKIEDYDCLCDGFANFPATFTKDFKINVGGSKISLYYIPQKGVIRDATVGNFRESSISGDKVTPKISDIYSISFSAKEVAGKFYPLSDGGPVITDKLYKTAPDTITYVTSTTWQTDKSFLEQQSDINNRTKCMDWRPSAINKFMEFVTCANSNSINANCQFSVKDANAFNVNIGGTPSATASLFYNQQSVKKYDPTQKKSIAVNSVVPALCDASSLILQNGESVKINATKNGVCLKKL